MDGQEKLILIQNENSLDIAQTVSHVKWGGRKGSAARTLNVILADDANATSMLDIKAEEGHQCIYYYDGEELFRGMIMQVKHGSDKRISFVAYDNGIYLANNSDTFSYEGKTVGYIFKDVCKRFGIPYSECKSSSYKIPSVTRPNATAYDALCDAMSQVYQATGTRHYIDSEKGALRLKIRKDSIMQWVVEAGGNLISYTNCTSIEQVKTRIKIISNDGKVVAERQNKQLEAKIGIMQSVEQADNSLTKAQLDDMISSIMKNKCRPEKSLKVEALGIADCISGMGLFIIIPELNISQTYYIDEDTHTFENGVHKMSLTLNLANDAEYSDTRTSSGTNSGNKTGSHATGKTSSDDNNRTVYFKGGYQYLTANSSSPNGVKRKAGKAKVTMTASDTAKHKYHIVGGKYNSLGGECNAYGWVNASDIKS